MPTPIDKELYELAKKIVYSQYEKPSAYRSMALQKKYKELGGRYAGKKNEGHLTQWQKEKWKDIGGKDYPVFRPTVKINKSTPLTIKEIDPKNLKKQIDLKQKIKGNENLPKFKSK